MPVIEARRENLPSIFGAVRPVMPFSSRKPLILPPCASDLAQTTKTSAIGELVIQVFAPESGSRRRPALARVRIDAGVGAGVGLGQAEAADPLAAGELRQVLRALLVGAVGVDRVHDEGGLDATSPSGSRESTRSTSRAIRP